MRCPHQPHWVLMSANHRFFSSCSTRYHSSNLLALVWTLQYPIETRKCDHTLADLRASVVIIYSYGTTYTPQGTTFRKRVHTGRRISSANAFQPVMPFLVLFFDLWGVQSVTMSLCQGPMTFDQWWNIWNPGTFNYKGLRILTSAIAFSEPSPISSLFLTSSRRLGRLNDCVNLTGSCNLRDVMIAALTLGVAVAVTAMMGTPGNFSRRSPSSRYDGLQSALASIHISTCMLLDGRIRKNNSWFIIQQFHFTSNIFVHITVPQPWRTFSACV